MSDSATYPSEQFPAPAAVELPRPEGWEPMPVPAALVSLGKVPHGGTGFQPNVVVTSRRGTGTTLEEAAQAVVAGLEASTEWEEAGREFRDGFGGRASFRIEGAFVHPEAGTLYQAALITVVERGPFTDMVQAVGTCGAAQTRECLPDIRTMLQGVTLGS